MLLLTEDGAKESPASSGLCNHRSEGLALWAWPPEGMKQIDQWMLTQGRELGLSDLGCSQFYLVLLRTRGSVE